MPDYERYEQLKAAWIAAHPEATPAEYTTAITRIAKECGSEMSGEWMKIELALPDKPEVHYIANALQLDPDAVVGKLLRVWAWFDKHTEDGNALGVTISLLDRITRVTGFGEAMMLAGWIEQHDATLCMPHFDRHTSQSSKKRALTAKRVLKLRNADVTLVALPREEKRRSKPPISPGGGLNGSFSEFWVLYPEHVGKGAAEKSWIRLNPDETLCRHILDALQKARGSVEWQKDNGQFIPHPATWLNQKRWEDELTLFRKDKEPNWT